MDFKKIIISLFLLSMLILSGCINIEVDQKIKRNGNFDMDFTISTSPEYKMMIGGLKEGFQVDDSVKDKFVYSETETSFTYSFIDIDPGKDKVLFKEVEEEDTVTDELTNEMFGDTDVDTDFSFIDPKNLEINKELKFPYYEFTYKLKLTDETEEEAPKEIETLYATEYIVDEANILDGQSKDLIMQSINEIYKNDSIEVIILTKEEMDMMDYYYYQYDFIDNFDFKNEEPQYILIFASINEDGFCSVESNIYIDSHFSNEIFDLDTDFSENCQSDYQGQITRVVTELNTYFIENDLDPSYDDMAGEMGELFKIGYTVEVFGKITDTNGLKMEDNKVKFDINPAKEGEYTIVFKDFFLATIFGDLYWVYLIVIGVVIIGGISVVVFSKFRTIQKSKPLEVPIAINPQVLDYVRKARYNGMNDAQIKNSLVKNGWSAREVDIALKSR